MRLLCVGLGLAGVALAEAAGEAPGMPAEAAEQATSTAITLAGNPSGLARFPEQCTKVEEKAAVRCCSDSAEQPNRKTYGCHPQETLASATAICTSKGLRLCSGEEIKVGKVNFMGCGYDSARIWSSTICDSATVRRLQEPQAAPKRTEAEPVFAQIIMPGIHGPQPLWFSPNLLVV